ncbi:MAG TPA: amino acid racemase [Synergistaceae bacterium]|jgi:aspartate racemase|nr:aspartate/glutamate racemase family protein [Synergistaceae bacterium]NLL41657.1 aspartate/glutamate racemase family protein [Synergistaceae bacterium]HPX03035.1 amino acid racemase [Synergistaceae bacterium]HQA54198.1 amino acid racemase [Synergistaceae bacterium]
MSEKILGVLGGMGPAASAEFLKILAEKYPAEKDQDHPVVYMISDPKIPDRGSAIEGNGEDPSPYLINDLEKLIGWGAELLAVPCNTAHYFIDRFRDRIGVPIVHIIEATVEASMKKSPKGAWMISTMGTARSGLYQKAAADRGYRLMIPPEDVRKEIQKAIVFVKSGKMEDAARAIERVAAKLWEIEDLPIVTACTELPLAYDASDLPKDKNISSLDALADACIKALTE